MPWFKVDDSFYDHPKVFDAPDCAVALWTRAGTWSARNLTDGFVPTGMPARLCDDPDTAVKELVRRGLWTRTTGGWKFHDWAQYQPSKEAVADLRAKRAEAGRRGGQAKAAKQNTSNGVANASPVGKQNAAPARPDPTPMGGSSPSSTHGARDPGLAPPPPNRCEEHLNHPNPPPCGPCGNARRARDAWERERAQAAAQQQQQTARARAEASRIAIDACQRCDHLGRLPDGRACQHVPLGETAKAREIAAAARAAIRRPAAPPPRDAGAELDAALAELTPQEQP